jgi:RNA polymerase sigma-70 factor, ECF subfamily
MQNTAQNNSEPEIEIEAIRSGDPAAFSALHAKYGPRVLGYLLRLGVCRADAEDITQETFLAAFRGCEGFSGRSRPLAWLLGIAIRRRRDRDRTPRPTQPLPTTLITTLITPSPVESILRAASLQHALALLDPPLREALLLVASQGLSYAEAAQTLETPLGTLKWRVHQATKQMRKLLTEEENS